MLCLSLLSAPAAVLATTANTLSDFGGEEEPTVIYHPATNTFTTGDTYVNITNPSSGVFEMLLRYSTSQWDGDRDTTNTDRQRAEVKTLGPNQLIGETYIYTTTWKMSSGFKGSGQFDHITQLKPVDGVEGSSGAPLVTTSLGSGSSAADVEYASTSFSPADVYSPRTVRSFTYTPNTFLAESMKITPSADGGTTGQVEVSINGDSYSGVSGVEVSRPSSTTYYPKWGFYRGCSTTSGYGPNDYVQHKAVTASKQLITTLLEAESLSYTTSGQTLTTQSDSGASGGVVTYLNATGTNQYVEFTTPAFAAGTYQLKYAYKHNSARGQHNVTVDGTAVGGTIDEYSSSSGYTTVTVGNVTFSSFGTHKIRLTVTGKNSSSTGYVIAPDEFTLVQQ